MTAPATDLKLSRDSLLAYEPSQGLKRIRRRGYQRYLAFMAGLNLAFLWKRRWFFITMVVGFLLMAAPTPSGLTHEGQIVLVTQGRSTLQFGELPQPLRGEIESRYPLMQATPAFDDPRPPIPMEEAFARIEAMYERDKEKWPHET